MFKPLIKLNSPLYHTINDPRWPPTFNEKKLQKLNNIKSKARLTRKLTILNILTKVLSLLGYFCTFLWVLFLCFIGIPLLKQDINPKYQIDIPDTLMLIGCLSFFYFLTMFLMAIVKTSKYKTELIKAKLNDLN